MSAPRDTVPTPPLFADDTQPDIDVPPVWPPVVDEEDGWSIPLHAAHLDELDEL